MMPPPTDFDDWSLRCRETLSRYAEPLLRAVAAKLIKPRGNQPLDELLDKSVAALTNPPVIDRRIRELPESVRRLLALIGLSRQPRWKVGHLLTLLASLEHAEGFVPIASALESGLLFPRLSEGFPQLEDFGAWFGSAGVLTAEIFVHPSVALRARSESLGLPNVANAGLVAGGGQPRVADGLDWLLRLAAVRQQVDTDPVRVTQSNALFKKDLIRLQTDEVLS